MLTFQTKLKVEVLKSENLTLSVSLLQQLSSTSVQANVYNTALKAEKQPDSRNMAKTKTF